MYTDRMCSTTILIWTNWIILRMKLPYISVFISITFVLKIEMGPPIIDKKTVLRTLDRTTFKMAEDVQASTTTKYLIEYYICISKRTILLLVTCDEQFSHVF